MWVVGKAKLCYDMNMEFGKNNFCYDINVNVWVKEFGKAKPCYDTNMEFGKNNFCYDIIRFQFHVKYLQGQQTCRFWQRLNFKNVNMS